MENEITIIQPEQFGLEKKQASTIEEAFKPKIEEREILSTQYGELIKQDITKETCTDAKKLRLQLVKVRTGISDIHKKQKSFYLAAGKFVDAWKNKETLPVTQMEEGLSNIETHFEQIEEVKREEIRKERSAELEKYETVYDAGDVALLDDVLWGHFLNGVKTDYEAKKAEEERVEKETIEAQRKQDLFTARKEKLVQFSQFGVYQMLAIETSEKQFIGLVKEGADKKKAFDKKQAEIESENEQLKKEAEEKEEKEKELELRNSKRNDELRPYIVFIRDYTALLNSDEKDYQKQLKDIKAGAELQWESDRKEQQRKADQEQKEREDKEKLTKENAAKIEADRKAELAPDKERLTKWVNDISIPDIVNERMSKESVLIADEITEKFNSFKKWAKGEIEKIK